MAMCISQLVAAPARLERMLASALAREERFRPRLNGSADRASRRAAVGPRLRPSTRERTDVLLWLRDINYTVFKLCPNNFALALNVFDRFLALVKVQPKHIRCIAAASFLIAAKITQEPESEPSASEIVQLGSCNFTHSDITRMERIILDKLSWDVDATTSLSLLQLMHALVCSWGLFQEAGVSPVLHLRSTVQHLEACMLDENFTHLKPSALALAVLGVELRQIAFDWLDITIELQTLAGVTGHDLGVCYEAVQTRTFHVRRLPTSSRRHPGLGDSKEGHQPSSASLQGLIDDLEDVEVVQTNSPMAMDMSLLSMRSGEQTHQCTLETNSSSNLNPAAKPFQLQPCTLPTHGALTAADRNGDKPPLAPLKVERFVAIGFPPRCGSRAISNPSIIVPPVKVA